jgi:hypothetical protein
MQLLHNDKYLRRLMELAIDDGLLSTFHEIVPYNLMFSTDSYIDELLEFFYENDKQARKMTRLLLRWFQDKVYLNIDYDYKQVDKEFFQRYDPAYLYFYYILSGNYKAYIDMFQEGQAFMTVSSIDYEQLLEENKRKERNIDYEKQYLDNERQLKLSNEKLKECESHLAAYQIVLDRHPELKAKAHLIQKQIAIFIGTVNSEKLEKIKEKYQLKELKIYSSLDTISTLLPAFDYVIFSTQMAKHSTYYQVKSYVKGSILHTDKLNLELILEELVEYIQKKVGNNDDSI